MDGDGERDALQPYDGELLSLLGDGRPRKAPKGVDPNLWAQLEAQRDAQEWALKVERTRRRGDAIMSLAQATAVNPFLTNAAVGLAGATVGTVAGLARHYANQGISKTKAQGKLLPWRVPVTALEVWGDGVLTLAGANVVKDDVKDILQALRGASTATSIAYDIPDSEGPALLPVNPASGPFRSPGGRGRAASP